jgi:O-antigen/teichoic acid export membrane protein
MSIKKNTLWNLFGSAAPMIIGVAALPYIYHKISTERLGVLTIVWALIGYCSIFDFGLGRAITQRIAASTIDHNDNMSVNTTATTGVILTLVIGIAGAGVGLIAIRLFGVGWMNANKGLENEIYSSFILACIAVPATTTTAGMRGILEGLQQFSTVNVLKFILGASNFLGPLLSIILFGPNLASIVATLVIARIAILLAHYYAVHSYLSIANSRISIEEAKKLFRFGGWMTISNLISPIMVVSDRLFISHFMGAAEVAYYTIPAEFLLRLLIIPAALTATFFPIFSMAISTRDDSAIIIYRKATKIILGVMGLITVLICVGSKWGLALWLGSDFALKSYGVTSILAVGILFNSLAQIPFAFIQASGDARTTALIHILEALIYIPTLLLMMKAYGITGVAIAWTFRALLDLVLLHAQAKRVKNEYCHS